MRKYLIAMLVIFLTVGAVFNKPLQVEDLIEERTPLVKGWLNRKLNTPQSIVLRSRLQDREHERVIEPKAARYRGLGMANNDPLLVEHRGLTRPPVNLGKAMKENPHTREILEDILSPTQITRLQTAARKHAIRKQAEKDRDDFIGRGYDGAELAETERVVRDNTSTLGAE